MFQSFACLYICGVLLCIDDFKAEPITRESLKEEKAYQKLYKKQQKEMGSLMKKHIKEQTSMMKNQCNQIEKYMKSNKE